MEQHLIKGFENNKFELLIERFSNPDKSKLYTSFHSFKYLGSDSTFEIKFVKYKF